jgi:predicted amidohydrolase
MDRDVTVEVAQIASGQCWHDPALLADNEAKVASWYERVADEVDLLVFPELALTGYIPLKGYDQAHKRRLADVAARAYEEALPRLTDLTRARRAGMVFGLMEPSSMRFEFFNSIVLVEDGHLVGAYRKLHLPVEENHYFAPGDSVVVVPSRAGRVGLSICYDLLFPEVGRMLALEGAELTCVCSNWLGIANLPRLGEVLPVARALENQYHVVFVNGVGELEVRGRRWSLYGASRIVSADGNLLATAGQAEEGLRANLPVEALARAHDVFPVLRDRRPDRYAPLTGSHTAWSSIRVQP